MCMLHTLQPGVCVWWSDLLTLCLCDGIWYMITLSALHPRYIHLCCLLYTSLHAALSLTYITILWIQCISQCAILHLLSSADQCGLYDVMLCEIWYISYEINPQVTCATISTVTQQKWQYIYSICNYLTLYHSYVRRWCTYKDVYK